MPYKLSPSSLSLFKECPRCFWLRFRKGIFRPEAIFPSLPSGMDIVLKTHFDSFMARGLLPPELAKLKGEVKLFDNIELLREWRSNQKGVRWTDRKGNILRGAVDNLLKKGSKLTVLDYKTRGFPLKEETPEYAKNQLDIYNFLLRKNGYATEDYSYLLFYHPLKVNEKGDVIFHTDLIKMKVSIKNAENIFRKALKVLDGRMPKAGEGCQYCKWVEICRM